METSRNVPNRKASPLKKTEHLGSNQMIFLMQISDMVSDKQEEVSALEMRLQVLDKELDWKKEVISAVTLMQGSFVCVLCAAGTLRWGGGGGGTVTGVRPFSGHNCAKILLKIGLFKHKMLL